MRNAFNDIYAISFSDVLYKSICCGYSFELPQLVKAIQMNFLFVLRFYGPVNPMGSCRARSVYLTTRLLGKLSPLSG